MKTIEIQAEHAGGRYPIYIGENLLQQTELLQQHIVGHQVLLVSNACVAPLYLAPIQQACAQYQCDEVILPDGEAFKNITYFQAILDTLINQHHHRDTTLIAVGGGVVGDMTGFAAACFQRGVNFIQIPTSLLAQVDSSIGGKTAINHPGGKNLIGAFHQPQAVIIDLNTLTSLPQREFNAGLAEIIKAALIQDANFFSWLEQNLVGILGKDREKLAYMIAQSCRIKRDIVAQDEKEHGVRALLNFGHTFGHAIENSLGYGVWLHGEAVAIGMRMAANLSKRMGLIDETAVTRINIVLDQADLPQVLPSQLNCDRLHAAMQGDKKILANRLRFILLEKIGSGIISDQVDTDTLFRLLQTYITD